MYLNGSLTSLNNSNNSSTVELDANRRASLSTLTQMQQAANLMSSTNVQSMGSRDGSNSNLNKISIGSIASPCKLCGNAISSMKCAECLNMQFCFQCDNMYHRHPKRKHHVRKSINLVSFVAYPSIYQVTVIHTVALYIV